MLIPRLSVAVGLATALIASQLPEFAQQYRQGLIGHIGELSRQANEFSSFAQAQDLSRDALVDKLLASPDKDARQIGQEKADDFTRLQRYREQLESFVEAGPVGRMVVLMRDFDPQIASDAYANFEPAVPTSSEGFISAFVGFLLGGGLIRLAALPFRRKPQPALPPLPDPRLAEVEAARTRSIQFRERMNRATLPTRASEERRKVGSTQ